MICVIRPLRLTGSLRSQFSTVQTVSTTKAQKRRRAKIPPSFLPGHGEKIWIHSNFVNGLTVYSHKAVLKANKALKQVPFHGKKLKPAKIRKDYWQILAMIQFPKGKGEVGRSVFHILRELRMMHELSWGPETMYDPMTGLPWSKADRGKKLNDQKANSIADLAVALSGAGKGNKIKTVDASGAESIVNVEVFWKSALDHKYATKWSDNVKHDLLTDGISFEVPCSPDEVAETEAEAQAADAEDAPDAEGKEEAQKPGLLNQLTSKLKPNESEEGNNTGLITQLTSKLKPNESEEGNKNGLINQLTSKLKPNESEEGNKTGFIDQLTSKFKPRQTDEGKKTGWLGRLTSTLKSGPPSR